MHIFPDGPPDCLVRVTGRGILNSCNQLSLMISNEFESSYFFLEFSRNNLINLNVLK